MNKRLKNNFSVEYIEGVTQFLEFVKYHINDYGCTKCPCKRFMNSNWDSLEGVKQHLLTMEIESSYTN